MTDFDENDVREMREQGDLREFLRLQMRPTRGTTPAKKTAAPPAPGRRPGEWPPGTSPPGPLPPQPPAAWDRAVADYREENRYAPGENSQTHPCGCGCTRPDDHRSQT